jgi:hypothetical protein
LDKNIRDAIFFFFFFFKPNWACLIEAEDLLWSVVFLLSYVLEMLWILHASDRLSRG